METIELFIVRDAANGDILWVTNDREDAEFEAVNLLGTFSGPKETPIPTQPMLETYEVELGDLIEEPRSGESLKRRVATRQRRRDREVEAILGPTKCEPRPDDPDLITSDEVLTMLGAKHEAERLLAAHDLPRSGRTLFYRRSEIDAVLGQIADSGTARAC